MLRLGRLPSKLAGPAELEHTQAALAKALLAREEAEKKLAASAVAKQALEQRIADIEGGDAAREHERRARELESVQMQLQSIKDSSSHEQEMMRDALAEREREAGLLNFRLKELEHTASEREKDAGRLAAELEECTLQLVEERKQRCLAEQLPAETSWEHEASQGLLRAAQAELEERAAESARMRAELNAARAERDDASVRLSSSEQAAEAREVVIVEMRSAFLQVCEA